ncbi:hypothetical protein ACFQO1_13045 [Jejudonia soesokkakensis]|uniref:SGNH/GDSL hydrolase family protein n=1 Tax=Jejudonia soesokkakensis TaxID=1323432 RepID=A0ABW2MUI9_9FLAO
MQKKFISYLFLFFIPVVLGYLAMEYATRSMDTSYKRNEQYLKESSKEIETLVLGSSHMRSAVNVGLLKGPAINLASGNQHHDTDFKLLKGMIERLPNLKTVVIEASYSHFEYPHNGKNWWKHSYFLKYYDINTFERPTYFKDRLVYRANAPLLSERLYNYYLTKDTPAAFTAFGFNTNNYFGRFKTLNYNEDSIAVSNFRINTVPNLKVFSTNTSLFYELLEYCKEKNLNFIICTTPTYKTYLPKRNEAILKRRDSIFREIQSRFSDIQFLEKEADTINYNVRDYWNQSHLNPDGATKFTAALQQVLNDL